MVQVLKVLLEFRAPTWLRATAAAAEAAAAAVRVVARGSVSLLSPRGRLSSLPSVVDFFSRSRDTLGLGVERVWATNLTA
jgi:hypothetical protein